MAESVLERRKPLSWCPSVSNDDDAELVVVPGRQQRRGGLVPVVDSGRGVGLSVLLASWMAWARVSCPLARTSAAAGVSIVESVMKSIAVFSIGLPPGIDERFLSVSKGFGDAQFGSASLAARR